MTDPKITMRRLGDACIAMDDAIAAMMPPLDKNRIDRTTMFKERQAIQQDQKILYGYTAEIYNLIQKIQRRLDQ